MTEPAPNGPPTLAALAGQAAALVKAVLKPVTSLFNSLEVKVVYVAGNYPGNASVDTEQGYKAVCEALQASDLRANFSHVEFIPLASLADLRSQLYWHRPHVLHINVHGRDADQGGLVFQRNGVDEMLSEPEFQEILRRCGENLRLVVLNACYSLPFAESAAGVGVPCATGVAAKLSNANANLFTSEFYGRVFKDAPIESAFAEASKAMAAASRAAETSLPSLRRAAAAGDHTYLLGDTAGLLKQAQLKRRALLAAVMLAWVLPTLQTAVLGGYVRQLWLAVYGGPVTPVEGSFKYVLDELEDARTHKLNAQAVFDKKYASHRSNWWTGVVDKLPDDPPDSGPSCVIKLPDEDAKGWRYAVFLPPPSRPDVFATLKQGGSVTIRGVFSYFKPTEALRTRGKDGGVVLSDAEVWTKPGTPPP